MRCCVRSSEHGVEAMRAAGDESLVLLGEERPSRDPQVGAWLGRSIRSLTADPTRAPDVADTMGASSPSGGPPGSKGGGCAESPGGLVMQATMVCSLLVFLYEGLAFNMVYLGRILPALGKDVMVIPFMVLFNVTWCLAVWSYVVAHVYDPGVVPKQWHEFVSQVGDSLVVVPARLEFQPGKATMCRKCGVPRPERAHHCHVCGVCVLRMDHHCPWIRNCVGFRNYKFFLLLVMYSTLTAAFALTLSMPELVLCGKMLLRLDKETGDGNRPLEVFDIIAFLVFGVLALLFLALLMPMLFTHLPLAAQNITSIESHYDDTMANPFDRGSALDNFAQVFGSFGIDWFFPVPPQRLLSDGVTFSRSGADAERWDDLVSGEEPQEVLWGVRYSVVNPKVDAKPVDLDVGPLSAITRWMTAPGAPGALLALRCTRPRP